MALEIYISKENIKWIQSLSKVDEISCIIMGASKVDNNLKLLLQSCLREITTKNDNLLDVDRPLGTFSARIKIAYRLRLIDKSLYESLELIRKIRNDLAHSSEVKSINESPINERILSLEGKLNSTKAWKMAIEHNGIPKNNKSKFSFAMIIFEAYFEASRKLNKNKKIIPELIL